MRLILVIIVALLVGCGLLIGHESSASQATQRPSQRFTISKQGTLLKMIDADGKRSIKKVTGDGFKLNYKTLGKIRSASAIETKTNRLRTSSEPARYDGNKATAVVQTADKSLEITSELTFDATAGELIIKRKFRNISKHPVTLQGVWNHIDPKVVVRGPFNESADLISASLGRITAGLAGNITECGPGICPVPPICDGCPTIRDPNWNPNRGFLMSILYPSKTNVVLGWPEQITLKPQLPRQPGDEVSIAIRVLIK
jgi:hypothetical protein